jgi:hypothetical protein
MSTLDDLRSVLEEHAGGLDDTERYVRPVAVRARIRTARRRRTTAATVAAAALVLAGVAGVSSLRQPSALEPAGPSVLGLDVPDTWFVNEFPYELEQTASFAGDGDRVELAGDQDDPERAVAFYATGLGSGSATLLSDGEAIARATGEDDAELPVPISSTSTTLEVRLDDAPTGARTGIAVYTATDELAEGVSNGTAVFRQVVAGSELLAGDFSDQSRSEVTFEFTGSLDEARFATYCVAAEKGLWLNLSIDGEGHVSTQCHRVDSRDPGSSWSSFPEETGPAGVHTVRAFLTRDGRDSTPVPSPGAVVGAAVYRQPIAQQRAAGTTVGSTTEFAGRVWRLVDVMEQPRAQIVAGRTDLLLGFATRGALVRATWEGELVPSDSTSVASPDSTATFIGGVLLRGDTYDVRLDPDEGELSRGALLVYRPL